MKLLIRPTSVKVLDGHRVLLAFDDGSEGEVDLAPLLRGPVYQALLDDRALFEGTFVDRELRTLAWARRPEYERAGARSGARRRVRPDPSQPAASLTLLLENHRQAEPAYRASPTGSS